MCLYFWEYHNTLIIVVSYPILQSNNIKIDISKSESNLNNYSLFLDFEMVFAILGPLFSKQILDSKFYILILT